MATVIRRGEQQLADPNTSLGAGRDSLHSPLRGLLDYQGAQELIGDTATQAGGIFNGRFAVLQVPLDVLGQFFPFLGNADPETFEPEPAANDFITQILSLPGLLLGVSDPVPAGNLVGTIDPSQLSVVPLGSIGNTAANVLIDPNFRNAAAFDAIGDWDHDPAIDGGSAKTTADGQLHELTSNPRTAVTAGQQVSMRITARWAGLVSTGEPMALAVSAYDSSGQFIPDSSSIIAAVSAPGGSGTQILTGSYPVPAGVSYVRQRLVVQPIAMAGTVWFSVADQHNTQLLPADNVGGVGGITDIGEVVLGTWNAIVNGIAGVLGGTGASLTDVQNQTAAVSDTAQGAHSAAAQANATLAAQQGQAAANEGYGGNYWTISESGADGAALSATDWSATGPTGGDLCIRSPNEVGIRAAAPLGLRYYAYGNHQYAGENQALEVSLGSGGQYDGAVTRLYTHCNTARTEGAYLAVDNTGIEIGKFTRNATTNVFTFTPFTGGTYTATIRSGARVGFRDIGNIWSILVGGVAVKSVTDGTVAQDSSHRDYMVTMDRQHSPGFLGFGAGDYDSFRISALTAYDYVVPARVGSFARMCRVSTSSVGAYASAGPALYASFLDTLSAATADIKPDLTNGEFKVSIEGTYLVRCRIKYGSAPLFGTRAPVLYVNGVVAEYGATTGDPNATAAIDAIAADFHAYLYAGDVVQIGSAGMTASGRNIAGSADGAQTYLSIALINKSLA